MAQLDAQVFLSTVTASNLTGTNTGNVTLAAVGATPAAEGASLSGQVLTLQPASGTHPGLITTGAQTIAGVKTLAAGGALVFTDHGYPSTGIIQMPELGTLRWGAGVGSAQSLYAYANNLIFTGLLRAESGYLGIGGVAAYFPQGVSSAALLSSSVASGSDAVKLLDGARINLSTADASAYFHRSAANTINTPGTLSQAGAASAAGFLKVNSGDLASTTALNPGVALYGGGSGTAMYGFDLGYSAGTSRYRNRMFFFGTSADFAFSSTTAQPPTVQSDFTDLMVLRGDTGALGIGTNAPDAKAILQADSTTKGFLPPRMTTTQRDAIAAPPAGLVLFNTTTTKLECYDGATWQAAW